MIHKMSRVFMRVVIILTLFIMGGCGYFSRLVTYKDLSGPFFKNEIGCTIYFVFCPYSSLKEHVQPLRDLYAINPNGVLERQYMPNSETEADDFALTDYGYPIIIWNITRLTVLQSKTQINKSFKYNSITIDALSLDGKKAFAQEMGTTKDEPLGNLEVIDLATGRFLSKENAPWEVFFYLSCGGADPELKNILLMRHVEEGSYPTESESGWEPYLLHFDDKNKPSYKLLQFPPPEPEGKKEVIMIPYDGRIIGVTHDGQTARFYQSVSPYDEFTLLSSLETPPVEIQGHSRDGSKFLLSWVPDDRQVHYGVLEMDSGKIVEIFIREHKQIYCSVSLSPNGDRLVVVTVPGGELGNEKTVFSVYDTSSGQLIDTAEWLHAGMVDPVRVGY